MKINLDEIKAKQDEYKRYHGPIDSPIRVALYAEFAGRALGKTYAMINAIPSKTEVYILVPTQAVGRSIESEMRYLRPDINPKDVKYITDNTVNRDPDLLRRNPRPVFVDNSYLDNMMIRIVSRLQPEEDIW